MVRISFPIILLISSYCALSQTPYAVQQDPRHPEKRMLVGMVSPYILENDTSFSWYEANRKSYRPAAVLSDALASSSGKPHLIVFAGTWCEDSQFIIPRFFRALELAGFSFDKLVFYVLDRDKKMPGGLNAAFAITNVPTIIVMSGGKETGRVVEYGKSGNWEEELAALIR